LLAFQEKEKSIVTITGPVPASIWGRIWAKAIADLRTNGNYGSPINNSFKALLERNIREAVKDFVGDYVEPLFDENHRLACLCLRDFYDEIQKLERRNRAKLTRFRDNQVNAPDTDIDGILDKTRSNTWTLTELGTGASCTDNNDIIAPVGTVLKKKEWARVYAEAILDYQGYGTKLKKDPTNAIDTFPGAGGLNRAVGDPILQLPTPVSLRG